MSRKSDKMDAGWLQLRNKYTDVHAFGIRSHDQRHRKPVAYVGLRRLCNAKEYKYWTGLMATGVKEREGSERQCPCT